MGSTVEFTKLAFPLIYEALCDKNAQISKFRGFRDVSRAYFGIVGPGLRKLSRTFDFDFVSIS